MTLPTAIGLPLEIASELRVEGNNITARDLSYCLAVAWIAARRQPEEGTSDHYRIPDNRLRGALGLSRRDTIEVEESRFIRLRDAIIVVGDQRLPMPTVPFRGETPIRANIDDEMTWIVATELVEMMRRDGPVVDVPVSLLAGARVRSSIETYVKLAAYHQRGRDAVGVVAWAHDRIGIRMTCDDICDLLRLPRMPGSQLLQRHLEPAIDDLWNGAGITLEIETRRSVTRRSPTGRIRDIMLHLHVPSAVLPDGQLPLGILEPPGTSWAVKPRVVEPKPEREAPASTVNVTVLRPRTTHRPLNKIAAPGSAGSKPGHGDIEF